MTEHGYEVLKEWREDRISRYRGLWMTKYEYAMERMERAYREWARCGPGIRSLVWLLIYKHRCRRLNKMPLYEAMKQVCKDAWTPVDEQRAGEEG
jgi:hypothetical protein